MTSVNLLVNLFFTMYIWPPFFNFCHYFGLFGKNHGGINLKSFFHRLPSMPHLNSESQLFLKIWLISAYVNISLSAYPFRGLLNKKNWATLKLTVQFLPYPSLLRFLFPNEIKNFPQIIF